MQRLLSRGFKDWIWKQGATRLHLRRRLGSGVEIEIGSFGDWCLYNDIFVEGEYDPAIASALAGCDRDRFTVVDLGANVGFFTLRVADRLRRARRRPRPHLSVLMVEGSPKLDAEVKRRIAHLADPATTLTVLNGLVGKAEGRAHFEYGRSQIKNRVTATGEGPALSYLDLHDHFARIGPIDLLKADIEGSEFDFLASYPDALAATRNLAVEFHRPHCPPEAGIIEVRKHGFENATCLQSQGLTETWFFSR